MAVSFSQSVDSFDVGDYQSDDGVEIPQTRRRESTRGRSPTIKPVANTSKDQRAEYQVTRRRNARYYSPHTIVPSTSDRDTPSPSIESRDYQRESRSPSPRSRRRALIMLAQAKQDRLYSETVRVQLAEYERLEIERERMRREGIEYEEIERLETVARARRRQQQEEFERRAVQLAEYERLEIERERWRREGIEYEEIERLETVARARRRQQQEEFERAQAKRRQELEDLERLDIARRREDRERYRRDEEERCRLEEEIRLAEVCMANVAPPRGTRIEDRGERSIQDEIGNDNLRQFERRQARATNQSRTTKDNVPNKRPLSTDDYGYLYESHDRINYTRKVAYIERGDDRHESVKASGRDVYALGSSQAPSDIHPASREEVASSRHASLRDRAQSIEGLSSAAFAQSLATVDSPLQDGHNVYTADLLQYENQSRDTQHGWKIVNSGQGKTVNVAGDDNLMDDNHDGSKVEGGCEKETMHDIFDDNESNDNGHEVTPPSHDESPIFSVRSENLKDDNHDGSKLDDRDDNESNDSDSDNSASSQDRASIFSHRSFSSSLTIPSQYSTPQQVSAVDELVILLADDPELSPLYEDALKDRAIGPNRFERNFRRLLQIYSEELRGNAHDDLHIAAVQLIRSRAQYIAAKIRGKYDPEPTSVSAEIKDLESTVTERERMERVEQFLDQLKPSDSRELIQANSSNLDDEDVDLPNLTSVIVFLVSGKPYDNLRKSFHYFVRPSMKTASPKAGIEGVETSDTKKTTPPTSDPEADLSNGFVGEDHYVRPSSIPAASKTGVEDDGEINERMNPTTEIPPVDLPPGSVNEDAVSIGSKSPSYGVTRPSLTSDGVYRACISILGSLSMNFYSKTTYSQEISSEPPLEDGKVRVRWTCRCGAALWDDFTEFRPGAAEQLRMSLQPYQKDKSKCDSSTKEGTHSRPLRWINSKLTEMRDSARGKRLIDLQVVGLVKPDYTKEEAKLSSISQTDIPILSEGMRLRTNAAASTSGQPSGNANQNINLTSMNTPTSRPTDQTRHTLGQAMTSQYVGNTVNTQPSHLNEPDYDMKFLLLCIGHKSETLRLRQPNVENISDDVALFQLLKDTYNAHRGLLARWISPRRLVSIKFRKFERHARDRVVILSTPTISDRLPKSINPVACHEDHRPHPKCDTEYEIEPTTPDLDPYVGPNALVHWLNEPHEAEEEGNNLRPQTVWLRRFPKKKKTQLTACPPYQFGLGWGIELEEGLHLNRLMRIAILSLVISATVFLICWWSLRGDVQGASGTAALLVAYATLVPGILTAVAIE